MSGLEKNHKADSSVFCEKKFFFHHLNYVNDHHPNYLFEAIIK